MRRPKPKGKGKKGRGKGRGKGDDKERELALRAAVERMEAKGGTQPPETIELWRMGCEAMGLDGTWECREDCVGRESPFCTRSYMRDNQSNRKGLWKKDQSLLADVGLNPGLFDRIRNPRAGPRDSHALNPAGLVNLGATCYANSVLQCLFNVASFRKEMLSIPLNSSDDAMKHVILTGLHNLIAELQFGPVSVVNPESFLTQTLQLKGNVQQDCQEFWALLHSNLDAEVKKLGNKRLHGLLNTTFVGKNAYKTECSKCHKLSDSSNSRFDFQVLEMEVSGSPNLEDSLGTYLAEEVLEGDNQYYCVHCKSRQNALRSIQIHTLPPHLILQLKRFKFDLKTFQRKKIKSSYGFPLTIDMEPYLVSSSSSGKKRAKGNHVYDIQSIILHRGKSAAEGHYIAFVKREEDNLWWQFDDQKVTCIGEDLSTLNCFSKDKEDDGRLISTQVYIMMYKQRGQTCVSVDETLNMKLLPAITKARISDLVQSHNQAKVDYCDRKEKYFEEVKTRREQVETFLDLQNTGGKLRGDDLCVPVADLSSWTGTVKDCTRIDMNGSLCKHGLIDPEKIGNLKIVRKPAFKLLQSTVEIGPKELSAKMLCVACMKEALMSRLGEIDMRKDNEDMLRLYQQFLKTGSGTTENFFVSKKWLQRWMKSRNALTSMQYSPTSDIICKHGNLSPESIAQKDIREVPGEIWKYISECCGNAKTPAKEMSSLQHVCLTCMSSTEANVPVAVNGNFGDARKRRKVLTILKEIVGGASHTILKPAEEYSWLPLKWYYEWTKVLASSSPSNDVVLWDSIAAFKEETKRLLCAAKIETAVVVDDADDADGSVPKAPIATLVKVQDKRKSWRQELNQGNILILERDSCKRFMAAIELGIKYDLRVRLGDSQSNAAPKLTFTPNVCTVGQGGKHTFSDGEKTHKVWVYGLFGSTTERSVRKRKTALEFDVGPGTSLGDLKEKIQKVSSTSNVGSLQYCRTELQNDSATLTSLNIVPGDVLVFDGMQNGEGSYSSEGDMRGKEAKTHFEGTRLLS